MKRIKKKTEKKKDKIVFKGFIQFFCLYHILGRTAFDKMGRLPENGWQNHPFELNEIKSALKFFPIPDDQMMAAIEYCIESKMLKEKDSLYYMTIAGLGKYVEAYIEER